MKKIIISLCFSVLMLFTFAPEAEAQSDCRETCMNSKELCRDSARTAVRGCRMTCRAEEPADRRECRRTCRADLKEARSTCRGAIEECHDTCSAEVPAPVEPDDSGEMIDPHMCVLDCKAHLRQCSHEVLEAGRECSAACFDLRREQSRDCRDSVRPLSCLLGTFRDFGQCLSGCAHDTHAAGRACFDGFRGCREDCANPNPYGSASQAFLQAPSGLLD